MSKNQTGRKRRPQYMHKVDAYLFRYVDDPETIQAQEIVIRDIRSAGTKITASYSLTSGCTGGEVIFKEEQYLLSIERAEEIISLCNARIELINRLISHFTPEEQEFIKLFWFDVPPDERGYISYRNHVVLDAVPWFRDQDYRAMPGNSFYVWRLRIYKQWYRLLFGEEPRDDEQGERFRV